MVDINKSDRIVISSNSKMELVIRWYMDNQELISEKGFVAPLKKGFVVLKEEGLGFSFEHKGNITTITIYPKTDHNTFIASATFDYNHATDKYTNVIYHCDKDKMKYMKAIMRIDNTFSKETLKFKAIMSFMAYYREYVIVDSSKPKKAISNNNNINTTTLSNNKHNTNSIISKTYIIDDKISTKSLGIKGTHNSPDHEFEVRGFYRHYKSGKVIWIDGFSKCKGKGKKSPKNYTM